MKRDSDGNPIGKEKPNRKQGAVGGGFDAVFRGYINLNLSDEQKQAFARWSEGSTLWDCMDYQVGTGVNLSIKIDPRGEGFLASATQRSEASPNAGLVVTARGRDARTAWGRVLYCLAILSEGERWEDTQPLANPDRW